MKSNPSSKLIFVYGSLRPSQYNFDRVNNWIEGEVLKPVTRAILPGFELVNLGVYPAIVPEGDSDVVGDILECPPELFANIDAMERGAGYKVVELKAEALTRPDVFEVFVWVPRNPDALANYPRVLSGDWAKR